MDQQFSGCEDGYKNKGCWENEGVFVRKERERVVIGDKGERRGVGDVLCICVCEALTIDDEVGYRERNIRNGKRAKGGEKIKARH